MNLTRVALILGLVGAMVGAAWLGMRLVAHPRGPFLLPEGGAEWIQLDSPLSLFHWDVEARQSHFTRQFSLEQLPVSAVLRVRAYRVPSVSINGRQVVSASEDIEVAAFLRPGRNRLTVSVENHRGPPALLVASEDLDVSTPRGWRARTADGPWSKARAVSERPPFAASRMFPSASESLVRTLPYLVAFFLIGALASPVLGRYANAGRLRWILMGAWAVLCGNNIWKIPVDSGFDVMGHYQYVSLILETGKLPIASDGWTTFHPPLFYLLAALPASITSGRLEPEGTMLMLRVLPMLCGLAQIEIAYRSSRIAFPGRNDLQAIGTAVGGFLPMNLYISQTVSNEPLSGCLTALLICFSFGLLVEPSRCDLRKSCGVLGLLFGLALLVKTSVVVLLPAILLLIYYLFNSQQRQFGELAASWGVFLATIGLLAGWYYVRNWMLFGDPFLGGWEPGRGFDWWQDPGYRIPQDFLSFGESLTYPVFSSAFGFWDGLYSTLWVDGLQNIVKKGGGRSEWNYDFMLAMVWVSVPLSVAGAAGALQALRHPFTPFGRMGLFSVACLVSMLAAILMVFVSAAAYCAVKSTYALGLLPCFAVLSAAGFGAIPRGAWSRAVISGYLSSWLAFGYIAYFAR